MGIREIGTFQVLRSQPENTFPPWLVAHIEEAKARVRENKYMQSVLQLFTQNWRKLTHEELTRSAGPLASFVTLLSQVLETPTAPDPRREFRSQTGFQESVPAGFSPSSQMSSSPPDFPNKRVRKDRSSSSYWPSDESDQSTHDQRWKSEATTNACVYELLRCVTEISREKTDPSFRLEWTITQDTVTVQAGPHKYSTTNDGNFVHKDHRMGYWQRVSDYSYCSIEASLFLNFTLTPLLMRCTKVKSWHDTIEKPISVKAQEAAHMIAMFSQYVPVDGYLQHDLVWVLSSNNHHLLKKNSIPLVSGAQNLFSLVISNFPIEYQQYLHDGSQSDQLAFVKIEEYGMFKMQDPEELRTVFTIIVALNLKLQSIGPVA